MKTFTEENNKFYDKIRKDIDAVLDVTEEHYKKGEVEKHIMCVYEDTLEWISRDINNFLKEYDINAVDILKLSDSNIIDSSVKVLQMAIELFDQDSAKFKNLAQHTFGFFTSFMALIGGNREIREELASLESMFNIESRTPKQKMSKVESVEESMDILLKNIGILNIKVEKMIKNIDRANNMRKAAPTLSQHFLQEIKKSLDE